MKRKEARELIFKLLYEMEMRNVSADEVLNNVGELDDDRDYVINTVKGVYENKHELDSIIEKYLKGWNINRINKVDLSILRFSIYELKSNSISPAITVNEAVNLAKKFSTEKSGKFVNGVLGTYLRKEKNTQ